jgi:hypothetical protein
MGDQKLARDSSGFWNLALAGLTTLRFSEDDILREPARVKAVADRLARTGGRISPPNRRPLRG